MSELIDSYVDLLLHFDGADGATSDIDSSGNNHILTFHNTAQLDTAVKKFGLSALLLDGNSDYITIPDSTDWNLFGSLTGDITHDFWYRSADGTPGLEHWLGQFVASGDYWTLRNNPGLNGIQLIGNLPGGVPINIITGTAISDTDWHHIAVVKQADDFKVYLDGVEIGQGTQGAIGDVASTFDIGARGSVPDRYVYGSMDEIRISNGAARWTANFTPYPYEYSRIAKSQWF